MMKRVEVGFPEVAGEGKRGRSMGARGAGFY